MKRTRVVIGIAVLVGLAACGGKSSSGAPAKAAPQGAPSDAKSPTSDGKTASADPKGPVAGAPNAGGAEPDLGARFVDPPWFRKHLFPEATKVDLHRTKADANGFFTSNLRFFLPAGQTPEGCAKFLQEKVGAEVKNLESKQLEDGRFELKGTTERYRVTMQCGAPKGELIAFVSYQWTA